MTEEKTEKFKEKPVRRDSGKKPVIEEFISSHMELSAANYLQVPFRQFCASNASKFNGFASESDFQAAAKAFLEGK